jgi:hypothetical protein
MGTRLGLAAHVAAFGIDIMYLVDGERREVTGMLPGSERAVMRRVCFAIWGCTVSSSRADVGAVADTVSTFPRSGDRGRGNVPPAACT